MSKRAGKHGQTQKQKIAHHHALKNGTANVRACGHVADRSACHAGACGQACGQRDGGGQAGRGRETRDLSVSRA